jgi:hypothetical protein
MANRDRLVKASSPFAALLERATLRRLSGASSFERGEDYFLNGQVKALAEHDGTITAKVRGTYPYRVKLWIEKHDLRYSRVPVLWVRMVSFANIVWLWDSRGSKLDS